MSCPVQWNIGENDNHVRVFHLAEGELGFGLGPVSGDDLGGGPVVRGSAFSKCETEQLEDVGVVTAGPPEA